MLPGCILLSVVTVASAASFLGIELSQGCVDFVIRQDPNINSLGPVVSTMVDISKGTPFEGPLKQASEALNVGLQVYNGEKDRVKKEQLPKRRRALEEFSEAEVLAIFGDYHRRHQMLQVDQKGLGRDTILTKRAAGGRDSKQASTSTTTGTKTASRAATGTKPASSSSGSGMFSLPPCFVDIPTLIKMASG